MGEHAEMSHLDTSVTAGLDSMESNAKCKQGFSGNRCKVRRPCSLDLCLNGGTCVDGSFTNSKYGFACVCLPGFDGIMCEKHLPDDLGDTLQIA